MQITSSRSSKRRSRGTGKGRNPPMKPSLGNTHPMQYETCSGLSYPKRSPGSFTQTGTPCQDQINQIAWTTDCPQASEPHRGWLALYDWRTQSFDGTCQGNREKGGIKNQEFEKATRKSQNNGERACWKRHRLGSNIRDQEKVDHWNSTQKHWQHINFAETPK